MSESHLPSNAKMIRLAAVVIFSCAGVLRLSWAIPIEGESTSQADEITEFVSDPNQIQFKSFVIATVLQLIEDPNAFAAFITTDEPDPGQTPIRESEKPHKYWQRRYHRQVNDQLFAYLKYPYGDAGGDYSQSGPKEIAAVEANSFGPMREGIVAMTDLIHRWRDMNESEGTMLEVVRAIELTKAATQIYRLKPKLAVAAKRTVGRIGQLNRKFDLTSKMAIELILRGFAENELRNRTEKHLTDLEALLDLLARQNDALSEALGMGRIDRMPKQPDYLEKIDYSAHLLPRPITMDP